MTTQFLHGVETIETGSNTIPIRISAAGPIGLIGTADLADVTKFPLNTPILLTAQPLAAQGLGATGTLLGAIEQIYAEAGAAVVMIRVADDVDPNVVMSNIIGDPVARTGVNAFRNAEALVGVKPRTFIAPGYTSQRPYGVTGVALSGTSGSGAATIAFSPAGAAATVTYANGAYTVEVTNSGNYAQGTSITAAITGAGGSATAAVVTGNYSNPVVSALIPIATDLRGRIYADCPVDSDSDALLYRNDWDNERVTCFYPAVEVWDNASSSYVAAPASASNAGLTANVVTNQGFWFSPSNNAFQGVGGISSPIDYSDNPNDQANLLNAQGITVAINAPSQGYTGWRRWGNRTCATADLSFQFEAVRTACDMVYEAVQQAQAWAVDKPPSLQLLREMQQSVQEFFDYLVTLGALVGGSVWLDPEKNTPEQTSQGIWAWDFDPTPPAPMEHIQNYAQLNDNYYTALVSAIQTGLNGG
ncbi:phage tail sheath subtilisin-like domain-containing protein [Rhodoblastus sp.]|uniref:phage tail sheath subtilisin-like domain-containing protein n=1 Tax=Rhodoblastus sp. TaxID=1962975 RepID=UPI003F9E8249